MAAFNAARVVLLASGDAALSFRYVAEAITAIKDEIPSSFRCWNAERRLWTVEAPYIDVALAILRRFFSPVTVIDERQQQAPPPPPPPPRTPPMGPHAVLHLLPSAPPALIDAAWKCLAKLEHPDLRPVSEKAQATRRMQAINTAYDQLRQKGH